MELRTEKRTAPFVATQNRFPYNSIGRKACAFAERQKPTLIKGKYLILCSDVIISQYPKFDNPFSL
jgi:hypothetical protein